MLSTLFRRMPSGFAAALLAATVGAAGDPLHVTMERPHFICRANAARVSHTAYDPAGDADAPLPCCDGRIGCAQFLSTHTVLHGKVRWHS